MSLGSGPFPAGPRRDHSGRQPHRRWLSRPELASLGLGAACIGSRVQLASLVVQQTTSEADGLYAWLRAGFNTPSGFLPASTG